MVTVRIRRPELVPDGTPMAVSLRSTRDLVTGHWRTLRPRYVTRPSPCNLDCPAGTDVRSFLRLAARGDAAGAWRTILAHNPLPGVSGRVCYHPCESACNRQALEAAVAIHAVERAIADEAARSGAIEALLGEQDRPRGGRIAVVGAGPAGLSCAYHLARRGRQVEVLDAGDEPGGMLRYGIPAYRLPREILDREIDLLRRLGIVFRPRTKIRDTGLETEHPDREASDAKLHALTWSDLEAYDAVFVAVGAQRSRRARIPGEDLSGVRAALDVLRDVNSGRGPAELTGRVMVVGGGNTALDAARVARRLGAEVTILYRRSRAEMPAHPDEIEQAAGEGVRFVFYAAPVRFEADGERLAAITCQRMTLGAPDASGRRRPEPIPGQTFRIDCDHVLMALGEEVETEGLASAMAIANGRLQAHRWGRTPKRPLFAGGDAATGAGTVVDAIGSGRRAAEAIDLWLDGREPMETPPAGRCVRVDHLNLFYFGRVPRVAIPHRVDEAWISPGAGSVPVPHARAGFDEVVRGLPWPAAAAEAARCLSCGFCTECHNCAVFCPDAAVQYNGPGAGYTIDEQHCKGCGLCVAECPRGAMELVHDDPGH